MCTWYRSWVFAGVIGSFTLCWGAGAHAQSDPSVEGQWGSLVSGWPGDGNLAAASDPRFVDPANRDYRLRSDSPCRDAGLLSAVPNDVADVSLDGNKAERLPNDLGMGTRVEGGAVDIGAFEWHP